MHHIPASCHNGEAHVYKYLPEATDHYFLQSVSWSADPMRVHLLVKQSKEKCSCILLDANRSCAKDVMQYLWCYPTIFV